MCVCVRVCMCVRERQSEREREREKEREREDGVMPVCFYVFVCLKSLGLCLSIYL